MAAEASPLIPIDTSVGIRARSSATLFFANSKLFGTPGILMDLMLDSSAIRACKSSENPKLVVPGLS